jgi:spore cortex biosynthesis protein YabQ
MYTVPHARQLTIFICALGVGFLLGIIYDLCRCIRLSISESKGLVVFFDLLYFFIVSLVSFLYTLAMNKGEVRFYILLGEFIGLAFYYISFGIAVIKFTDKFTGVLKSVYNVVFRVVSAPFRAMKRVFLSLSEKSKKFFTKSRKKSEKIRKKHLPKVYMYVYNLLGILLANKRSSKDGEDALAKKTPKTKKKKNRGSVIVYLLCGAIVLALLIGIVQKLADNKSKADEKASLNSTLESLVSENKALEQAVSQGDEEELAEEYARKKGYVKPDERVYVDITPGL